MEEGRKRGRQEGNRGHSRQRRQDTGARVGLRSLEALAEAMERTGRQLRVGGTRVVTPGQRALRKAKDREAEMQRDQGLRRQAGGTQVGGHRAEAEEVEQLEDWLALEEELAEEEEG